MRPLRNEGRGRTPATQGSRRTESVALGAHNEGRSGTRQLPCRRPAGLHRATRPRNEGRGGTRQRSEHRMPRPGDLLRHATRAGGEPRQRLRRECRGSSSRGSRNEGRGRTPATPLGITDKCMVVDHAQRGPGRTPVTPVTVFGDICWMPFAQRGPGPDSGNACPGSRGRSGKAAARNEGRAEPGNPVDLRVGERPYLQRATRAGAEPRRRRELLA